jgi:parvulin-like peptidyl-prolyl isomerase
MTILVNGEKIEDSQIQQEIERLKPAHEKAYADMKPEERQAQLLEWSKDNLIEKVLFRQEIENFNLPLPDDKIETILAKLKSQYKDPQDIYKGFGAENDEQIKERIKLELKTRLIIEAVTKNLEKPSQQAIRQYYQENKEDFPTAEQVRVALITRFVNPQTDEQAAHQAICRAYDELQNGLLFELALTKFTEDKGEIAYIPKGRAPGEIEDVIFKLGIGQVSNIFRSRLGFHIAKVYEKIPPGITDFNQVKEHIEKIIQDRIQEEAFGDFLDQLREKAKIEEV